MNENSDLPLHLVMKKVVQAMQKLVRKVQLKSTNALIKLMTHRL